MVPFPWEAVALQWASEPASSEPYDLTPEEPNHSVSGEQTLWKGCDFGRRGSPKVTLAVIERSKFTKSLQQEQQGLHQRDLLSRWLFTVSSQYWPPQARFHAPKLHLH